MKLNESGHNKFRKAEFLVVNETRIELYFDLSGLNSQNKNNTTLVSSLPSRRALHFMHPRYLIAGKRKVQGREVHGRKVMGGKYTGGKYTGKKFTGGKLMGRKYTGRKNTGR